MNNLRKLQLTELNILKEFIDICAKYNLRYYAAGGTVLGAVRHQGFIPWDDDIDVAMPREDYDRFISIIDEISSENFIVSTIDNNDEHYTPFIQIYNPNISVIKKNSKVHQRSFVWLDIFPLDGLPDSRIKRFFHTRYFLFKRMMFAISVFKETANQRKDRPFHERIIMWFCNHFNIQRLFNRKKRLAACDRLLKKYNFYNTKYCCRSWSQYKFKAVFLTSYFAEGVKLKFEDMEIIVPENYDGYLTNLYNNDYMELPPVEKRNWHDIEILNS